jgi:hypothetical protein
MTEIKHPAVACCKNKMVWGMPRGAQCLPVLAALTSFGWRAGGPRSFDGRVDVTETTVSDHSRSSCHPSKSIYIEG